jgi:hypothetical protein
VSGQVGGHPQAPGEGAAERRRQAEILRALASRLDEGEPALPTDVFAAVAHEVERREDEAAIAAAWDEQADEEAEPWVFFRGRARG